MLPWDLRRTEELIRLLGFRERREGEGGSMARNEVVPDVVGSENVERDNMEGVEDLDSEVSGSDEEYVPEEGVESEESELEV